MASTLNTVFFNDFNGGLVTNRPASGLAKNESPDLDNILLTGTGFTKRLGDSEYNATAMNSGANVQGLTYFKPTSGVEYLVAVAGAKIFDSNAFDGTMDDRTGTATVVAGQNNIYTFSKLNDLCIGVGGAPSKPFKMAGGANAADLNTTDAPIGNFGFVTRNRMFIGNTAANPSTIYWSILSDPTDWTGVGSGNNAADVNDGDVLVGGIELNNNISLLFKNYSIHHLVTDSAPFPIKPLVKGIGCCGKNAMVNANGTIYFITNEPRMKSTDGYTITTYPDTIDDLWDNLVRSRLQYIQGVHDPVNNLIHWICSSGSATANNLDLVWDLEAKCWLRNTTGFDSNVVCLASGTRIFGGHTNGKIYEKYKASTYSDASEPTPGAVNGYWRTPWLDFQDPFTVKQMRYMDIIHKIQSSGNVKLSYGWNYNSDASSVEVSQSGTSGLWDVGTWDVTAAWGGTSYKQKRVFLFGLGNNFQLKIYNDTVGVPMEINGFGLAAKLSGRSDIDR